jgi:hypothetical protein
MSEFNKRHHEQMEAKRPYPEIDVNHSEAEQSPSESIDQEKLAKEARATIEASSKHSEQIKHTHEQSQTHHERPHHYITKQIKQGVFLELLDQTRSQLNKKETVFSKFTHNNLVENVSEVSAKTIARPNQILGGGIFMVLGGVLLVLLAKKYGFELPLSVFIVLYLLGYVSFLILELLLKTVSKLGSKRNS